ncbi:MAG TPA: DNA methyltransferase [Pirellulales bacterium]|nr:DNA methyltransferase [Pirellulales bacterium]
MPLSWNEIRHNAHAFAKDWAEESNEDAEAKTFWDEFFAIFGVKRRVVASFEEPVKNLAGNWAYIDLFWPSKLLVEHKSRGKSLDKANSQAMEYIRGLKVAGRDNEVPQYVVVSDFARIALHDLDEDKTVTFKLAELPKHVHAFAFIAGYKQQRVDPDDPVNIDAVELLGKLHDELEAGGYAGHDLERFLVRILFCLFADKTGIFDSPNAFALYIENHTAEDGSDLGMHLDRFFDVLDKAKDKRQKNLLEELAELPHVNGALFKERLGFADFNRAMREKLLECTRFDWSKISPAVFGSLFQSVLEPRQRRQVGAHYTSERDILKLVRSLFLDELRAEFKKVKGNKNRLREFHDRLAALRFLDPACGCGNFLVVTYREIRLLELDVLKEIYAGGQQVMDIEHLSRVDVDAMFGIEISEFPALIAEVAMWLIDHQMNQAVSAEFGLYYVRLPLRKSAKITQANALRLDWEDVLPAGECSYVLGNPPFVGAKYQNAEQRKDLVEAAKNLKNAGLLDYVAGWYFKATQYSAGRKTPIAFVSTNSITQGEQVGVLWNELFRRGIRIRFAHRTFSWESEARGKAHVHVVIIGFGFGESVNKRLYDYELDPNHPTVTLVKQISPYLVEGPPTTVVNRSLPICEVPQIGIGNKPIDDGNYLFLPEEKTAFLKIEPKAARWFRRWLGSKEFINGWERWCLWLGDCPPSELRAMPEALKRVEAVQKFRLASPSEPTQKLAATPSRFHVENMPKGSFLVIPKVSSERRRFIPIGFMGPETLVSDLCFIVPNAGLYHFGILSSTMHMAWVRMVGGRLESRYRYSAKLVYNNYPWPKNVAEKKRARVEKNAQAVLDARLQFPQSTLADLYDPLTMPAPLVKAHRELDRAADACYRSTAFENDRSRVEFLFALYEELTAPITAALEENAPRKRRKKATD